MLLTDAWGGGTLRAADQVEPRPRDPNDDFWFTGSPGTATAAGVAVDPMRAMRAAAVQACVRLLAESVAQLPLKVFRRMPDGNKQEATELPQFNLLHLRPHPEMTSFSWREMMMASLQLRGNAFAEILPGVDPVTGRATPIGALWPLKRDRVRPFRRTPRGEVRFEVQDENGRPRELGRDQVFHVPGLVMEDDGICGLSPIAAQAGAESVGHALAAQGYGARFFANSARPAGVIKHPSHFKDQEARDRFKQRWQVAQSGLNQHRTAILERGMEYQAVGVTNEEAQYLETRNASDVEIARIFRVPPHKIGILDRATFSNIEQQAIEFVVDTLLPWLVRWEQTMGLWLLPAQGDFFAEFNVAGLLRGDLLNRWRAYAIGRNWGWLSANDVRRLENMNGLGDEGDVYLQPVNMQQADTPREPSGQGRDDDGPRAKVAGSFVYRNGHDREDPKHEE